MESHKHSTDSPSLLVYGQEIDKPGLQYRHREKGKNEAHGVCLYVLK